MNIIQTDKAPAAIGPYSQAIEADNGMVFCSGQIGIDPATGDMQKGLEEQARQILRNIEGVLEAANVSKDHVVKTTVFVVDMNDFARVNELYAQFFGDHKPARSTVGVAALPKGALLEIEVLAVK
jgi:2-iminobutanoate/2-iminopropanoate deaminase